MEAKIKQHYTESSQDEDSGVKGFVSFDSNHVMAEPGGDVVTMAPGATNKEVQNWGFYFLFICFAD